MLEIVGILIFGSIVVSIIQGVKRGKVSLEGRKANPTLLERADDFVSKADKFTRELEDKARKYADKAEFELKYCSWFKRFRSSVTKALEISKESAAFERKLNSDPEWKRLYNEELERIDSRMETREDALTLQAQPEWLAEGPPPVPPHVNDPEMEIMRKSTYKTHSDQHLAFVDEVHQALLNDHSLAIHFIDAMTKRGLESLCREYFSGVYSAVCSPDIVERKLVKSDPQQELRHSTSPKTAISIWEVNADPSKRPASITGGGKWHQPNVAAFLSKNRGTIRVAENPQSSENVRARTSETQQLEFRGEINAEVEKIKIPHLVHFTRCENLESIFTHGLHSINSSQRKAIHVLQNDNDRLDDRLDGISLSMTFPNFRMFYKYRQLNTAADWAVLILSREILWKKKCGFFKYNAADSRMRKLPRAQVATVEALRGMFDNVYDTREDWLRPYDPTDPQAEVMVFDPIEASLIETVAFETKDVAKKWAHILGGIDTIYAGQDKGLFASRAQVRKN